MGMRKQCAPGKRRGLGTRFIGSQAPDATEHTSSGPLPYVKRQQLNVLPEVLFILVKTL